MGYNLIDGYNANRESQQTIGVLDSTISESAIINKEVQEDLGSEMPEIEIDGEYYIGKLSIPDLSLELPIISQWSYPGLRKAPCRYYGNVLDDNLVIIAHNYTRHFGKINKLGVNARIEFRDVNDTKFDYRVLNIDVVDPDDVEDITSGEYDLVLLTCTYGGNHRVAVKCERIV